MGTEYVFATVVGPLALLALILLIRRGMGLEMYASGADVAITLASIDFGIALTVPPAMQGTVNGSHYSVDKTATVMLLFCLVVCVVALMMEKAAVRYFSAHRAVAEGWCKPSVIQGIKGPFGWLALSWLVVAALLVVNVTLFATMHP